MSFLPLTHQASGHIGPLESVDGSLFCKLTSRQEGEFYTNIQQQDEDAAAGSVLRHWMPRFIGTLTPGIAPQMKNVDREIEAEVERQADRLEKVEVAEDKNYLMLTNVLYGYVQPSVMDIKLGSQLYDSNAPQEKKDRLIKVSEETTSGSMGFRICGMKLKSDHLPGDLSGIEMAQVCEKSEEDGCSYVWFNKFFGRNLKEETVLDGLRIFFRHNALPQEIQDKIVESFFLRLQMFYNCLLDQEIRVISGSLLFVFENDQERWLKESDPLVGGVYAVDDEDEDKEDEDEEEEKTLSRMAFIDFAHASVAEGQGYDENLVSGVESLMECIERV